MSNLYWGRLSIHVKTGHSVFCGGDRINLLISPMMHRLALPLIFSQFDEG